MAVIEIQFRDQVFFDIIAAQVVRIEPPAQVTAMLPAGTLIERIDVDSVGWAGANEVLFGDDELAVKVALVVQTTTQAAAQAAGSLQVPATVPVPCTVWLRLQGAPPTDLRWLIQRLEIAGTLMPVVAPPRAIRLGDLGVPLDDIRLAQGSGIVSIRCITESGSTGLGAPVNRLPIADWGQFIEGQVFADVLAQELNAAVDDAAAGSSDPTIEVSSRGIGHWDFGSSAAYASVELVAVDALPFDVDVPITIYAQTQVVADPVLDRLEVRTRITWAAHDIVTTVSGGAIEVVEDKVSDAILGKLRPPHGQEEIERGDRHVLYRSYRPLVEPTTNLFRASVTQVAVDGSGAQGTGPVNVYPPPAAFFTLEDQHWESHTDCTARQWKTEFHPPVVHILGVDRFYSLEFRRQPTASPDGFWTPEVSWSGLLFAGNQTAHVTFAIPPFGVKPVGQRSSGFIATNLGNRWVDLGPVPARPPAPADPIGIQAYVISTCMAISDRWGTGIMNLEWLVDPPDLSLGMPALREWTLVGTAMAGVDQVDLVAIGPLGERRLASVPVQRQSMFAQVITDAEEMLQVRSNVPLSSAPPQILQRWIVPWSSVQVGQDARELVVSDGSLYLVGRDVTRIEAAAGPAVGGGAIVRSVEQRDVPARVARRLQAAGAAPRTAGRGRSVAVLHRGMAVLGFAGPQRTVTEGAVQPAARSGRV